MIENEITRKSYVGAGTRGPFSTEFRFLDDSDLLVIVTEIATGVQTALTLTTDYTVTGAGETSGGEVELTVAYGNLAATHRITLINDPDGLQDIDYTPYDSFPAETHERGLDRLTIRGNRLLDLISRALRQPDGDADNIGTIPAKVTRASKFLAFDANGEPVAAAGTSADLGPVSAFVDTLLDDVDAAAFLTTLGISAFIQTLLNNANAATARTTLGAAADADVLKKAIEDQALTGGVITTSKDLGTITTGTVTPDPGDRPLQHYINGGAHTLAPSTNTGVTVIEITNNSSAGAITTSGFDIVDGDSFTTTDGDVFVCTITITPSAKLLQVVAMQ